MCARRHEKVQLPTGHKSDHAIQRSRDDSLLCDLRPHSQPPCRSQSKDGGQARSRPGSRQVVQAGLCDPVAVAVLPFFYILAFMPDRTLYTVPAPWKWLMMAGQAMSVIAVVAALKQTGFFYFFGLSQPFSDPARRAGNPCDRRVLLPYPQPSVLLRNRLPVALSLHDRQPADLQHRGHGVLLRRSTARGEVAM